MEACGTAHCWRREIAKFGQRIRLIPPVYVNPLVQRYKNDAADAEAIAAPFDAICLTFRNADNGELLPTQRAKVANTRS